MNYYDELIENIDKLIKEDSLNEASRIIENELSLAYIPREIEAKLNKYLDDIKASTTAYNGLTDEDIDVYLKDNFEHQLLAIDALCKKNLRDYIDICEAYLKNKDGYVNAKAILIDTLIRQEINYEFTYVNNSLLLKFNPINLKVIEETDGFKLADKFIYEYYLKEPSKYNIGIELLYKDALLTLPKEIDGKTVANRIIKYIDEAFSAN